MVRHYLDGQWLSAEDMKVSVFDLAVQRGFGIFEALKTYHRIPFMLDEHIDRLWQSAGQIGLSIPITRSTLGEVVREGLAQFASDEVNIKIIITGGLSEDTIESDKPSVIVMFTETKPPNSDIYGQGVRVVTTSHIRTLPTAKSLNYLTSVIAKRAARGMGAYEALYTEANGDITEGTTTNVFFVQNGNLVTAPGDILEGITRSAVLSIAQQQGIRVLLEKPKLQTMPSYSEAFITGSLSEIIPVVQVDGSAIGDGKVGPVTKQLSREFASYIRRYCKASKTQGSLN